MKTTLAILLFASQALATPYSLDPSHTEIGFSVKHLMISNVKGSFRKYSGRFDFEVAKNQLKNIDIEIEAASVDTNEADRDKHLRSEDFFAVDKYPKITFKSDKVEYVEGKPIKAIGTLKIRDKSRTITLDLDYRGLVKDAWGNEKLAFAATTKINRKDFGVNWNKALDQGGVTVGDDVLISIEGEASAKKK